MAGSGWIALLWPEIGKTQAELLMGHWAATSLIKTATSL